MLNINFLKALTIFLTFNSTAFAQSANQDLLSIAEFQQHEMENKTTEGATKTEAVQCDLRAGWRMATTGIGHPEQCKNSPNYLSIMREWTNIHTSIKYQ